MSDIQNITSAQAPVIDISIYKDTTTSGAECFEPWTLEQINWTFMKTDLLPPRQADDFLAVADFENHALPPLLVKL